MPGVAGLAIAGLWYILLALSAPIVEARRSRHAPPRWAAAWRAFLIGLGMVAAFLTTGWLIGKAVAGVSSQLTDVTAQVFSAADSPLVPFLRILGTVGIILIIVLAGVQVAVLRTRLAQRRTANTCIEPAPNGEARP